MLGCPIRKGLSINRTGVERGSFMIEIIREESLEEEQEKRELPKNIKQIGSPDIGDRIYIENKAYQYMHPYDTIREKTVYALLGKFESMVGRYCVFVEAAIRLEEIVFDGETPVWNDDSWAYLYKKLNHAYDDMVIVGWAMDIRGQLPNLTVALEKLHRTYFGGAHQILYMMDTLEKEDAIYSMKNGYLKKRDGYYVYYDKTASAALQIENLHEEKNRAEQPQIKTQEKDKRVEPGARELREKQKYIPSYSLSILLLLVICGLGYAAFQNHEKMAAMETALIQMNNAQTVATEASETVKVENIEGNVLPEAADNMQTEQNEQTDLTQNEQPTEMAQENQQLPGTENTDAQPDNTTQDGAGTVTETLSDSAMYLQQGYYIVQKGDNLAAICRKIYQTTAMMEKVCEANGIDNPDAIYEGQYLTLPN